jgi:hypothetical protein
MTSKLGWQSPVPYMHDGNYTKETMGVVFLLLHGLILPLGTPPPRHWSIATQDHTPPPPT